MNFCNLYDSWEHEGKWWSWNGLGQISDEVNISTCYTVELNSVLLKIKLLPPLSPSPSVTIWEIMVSTMICQTHLHSSVLLRFSVHSFIAFFCVSSSTWFLYFAFGLLSGHFLMYKKFKITHFIILYSGRSHLWTIMEK
jgi:hypothetical protein